MKIYLVLYQGNNRWNAPYAVGAWLDEAEAREQFKQRKQHGGVTFDSCELYGADDPTALVAKKEPTP